VVLSCDADYRTIFGTFVDPSQQKLASEEVLYRLQLAGIDISGISSIEFESGSVIIRIEADDATRRRIAEAVAQGRLSFDLPYTHRRGPSRETAWQPLDAQHWFSWYEPQRVRWEVTEELRHRPQGDFVVYMVVCMYAICRCLVKPRRHPHG
jgi:hypothetical protein